MLFFPNSISYFYTMEIEMFCFGITRDILGSGNYKMEVSEPSISVKDLRESLSAKFPEMKKLNSMLIAVNDEYAADDHMISENDEVALIPPVAGG